MIYDITIGHKIKLVLRNGITILNRSTTVGITHWYYHYEKVIPLTKIMDDTYKRKKRAESNLLDSFMDRQESPLNHLVMLPNMPVFYILITTKHIFKRLKRKIDGPNIQQSQSIYSQKLLIYQIISLMRKKKNLGCHIPNPKLIFGKKFSKKLRIKHQWKVSKRNPWWKCFLMSL